MGILEQLPGIPGVLIEQADGRSSLELDDIQHFLMQNVLSLYGTRGVLASILFIAAGSGIGWLLGGPQPDTRGVMALGTAQRNIAAALVVGGQNFSDPNVIVMNRNAPQLTITVVPDSGTGDLQGLSGKMTIIIAPDGKHSYDFEYALPNP